METVTALVGLGIILSLMSIVFAIRILAFAVETVAAAITAYRLQQLAILRGEKGKPRHFDFKV